MSTTGNRSAKTLLGLLIGSARASASLRKNQKEQEDLIEGFISTLQNNLRSAIDANLPLIYLVDAQVVADEMFNILQPAKLLKLQGTPEEDEKLLDIFQYFTRLVDPETGEEFAKGTAVYKYVETGKTVFDRKVSRVQNLDFINAYNKSYNILLNNRSKIVADIITEINRGIPQKIKLRDLNAIVANVGSKLVSSQTSIEAGKELRNGFQKYGVSIVEDAETFISGFSPKTQVLVIGQSFNAVTSRVHDLTTKALTSNLNGTGLYPATESSARVIGFKAGNFAAAGHSGIKSSQRVIGINTPQSLITSFILSLKNKSLNIDIFKDLVINTKHQDFLIDIDENYASLGNELLVLGISFARSQNSIFNSGELRKEEVNLVNKTLVQALSKKYRDLSNELSKVLQAEIKNPAVLDFIINKFRLSPTLGEHIVLGPLNILRGTKYSGPKGAASSNISRKNDSRNKKGPSLSQNKAVKKSGTKYTSSKLSIIKNISSNIANLESILNAGLFEQIKKNMGSGNRSDVLNYRTGRLARSAKIERISESRQGMITAFYSYMKNPYATFSQGGRQQYPRSRDPKLLISKSIREIAAPLVSNRLRAVNV